jgi:hypothetical protein
MPLPASPEDKRVTEINGLRLAYRGFVTGLAAGYVWVAAAMLGAWLAGDNPLAPLHLLGGPGRDGLLAGIGLIQVGSAAIGMTFAYFFGRFFTVRRTLAVAGLCFGVLAWLVIAKVVDTRMSSDLTAASLRIALIAASALYGVMLGAAVPTRIEVLRHQPAPTS